MCHIVCLVSVFKQLRGFKTGYATTSFLIVFHPVQRHICVPVKSQKAPDGLLDSESLEKWSFR